MKNCLVLMCTYNGEKYLREQLDSILAQKNINVFIKISDDCSTDNTVSILEEYCLKYDNLKYSINNENKGYKKNFLDLIFSEKNSTYDYYALSDQDDFWLPEKLQNASISIENIENPCKNGILYFSNLKCVDKNLNYMYDFYPNNVVEKKKKFNFMFENFGTGCTFVFNKAFLENFTTYYPKEILIHDYWIVLVATFSANYIYDKNSYILYRQHGNNAVGYSKSNTTKTKFKKILSFIKSKSNYKKNVEELICGYNNKISSEDKKTLNLMIKYKKNLFIKLKFIFFVFFRTNSNSFTSKLAISIKILFNNL